MSKYENHNLVLSKSLNLSFENTQKPYITQCDSDVMCCLQLCKKKISFLFKQLKNLYEMLRSKQKRKSQ